jgi:uncharacterized membrane protein HdeD (DUF308 family)
MAYALTPEEIAAGDAVTAKMEKLWGWYLAGGILSVLFGFVVISYQVVSLYALAYFASAYFIAAGVFMVLGSLSLARHRWLFLVMGILWIGSGTVGFAWPGITLYVIVILIGWSFLLFGVVDIMHGLHNHHMPHWWIHLIRGTASVAIAFAALSLPAVALITLVTLLGVFSVIFGVIEIISSFSARHATRHWGALKPQLH